MNGQDHNRSRVRLIWAAAAGLLCLELAAYVANGPASWLAVRVWALMGIGVLCVSLIEIGAALWRSLRRFPLVTVMTLCLLGAASFRGVSGIDLVMVNPESTQQVADGLRAFSEPDWRYTEAAFLGYPSRQYLIVALPALLLGRTLLALRLGYALVFVVGALVFWAGLRRAWRELPQGEAMAPLATLALLGFPYLTEFLRFFEQTILPVSLTLAATGWLLLARDRPTIRNLAVLTWVGAMLGTCYTPGLASWMLLYAAVLWLARVAWSEGRRGVAASWLAVMTVFVGFGLMSFASRTDLLYGEGGAMVTSPVLSTVRGLGVFFLGHPRAFLSPILYLPVMLFLVLALGGRLRFPGFVVASWSVGVVAAAGALHGYAAPLPDFGLHRAIVVAPPLIVACAWWVQGRFRLRKGVQLTFFLLLAGNVALDLWLLAEQRTPSLRDVVYGDMLGQARDAEIGSDAEVAIVLLGRAGAFDNAADYVGYFFPNARMALSEEEWTTFDRAQTPLIAYIDSQLWGTGLLPGHDAEAKVFRYRSRHRTLTYRRVVVRPDE